jgi:predicted porin
MQLKFKLTAVALAALGTPAFAQPSVSISGTIDLAVRDVSDGQDRTRQLVRDGINSSRLRFIGTEDLGGGLKVGFFLDMPLRADTGTAASTFWERRSTVSLYAPWGEIRLGRDGAISNSTPGDYDAFNGKGVGNVMNLATPFNFSNTATYTRVNNAISYVTPGSLAPFYAQIQIAPSEGEAGTRYRGAALGYKKDAIDTRFTYGVTDVTSTATVNPVTGVSTVQTLPNGGKFKYAALGASYDFGVARVMGSLIHWTSAPSVSGEKRKQFNYNIGVMVPVGPGSVNVAYTHADRSGLGSDDQDASQLAVQYIHNLSKRTALYASVAHIKQDRLAANDTAKAGSRYNMDGTTLIGRSATGFDLGIRHSF